MQYREKVDGGGQVLKWAGKGRGEGGGNVLGGSSLQGHSQDSNKREKGRLLRVAPDASAYSKFPLR